MSEKSGSRVAFLVAMEGIEQVELERPWQAVEGAGARPELLAPEPGEVQAFNHLDKADTFEVDRPVGQARVEDYAALVLPGGVANPDQLRTSPEAVAFVRAFLDSGKPVASICHAAWTLVETGRVCGRTLTSWPSLQTDVRNAGATWVDEQVHVDGNLITSRKPQDLDAFCAEILEALGAAQAEARRAS
jgi:protease I